MHYKRSFLYLGVFVLKLDLQGLLERFAHWSKAKGGLAGHYVFLSFDTRIDLKAAPNLLILLFVPGIGLPLEVFCVHPSLGDFNLQRAGVFQGSRVL